MNLHSKLEGLRLGSESSPPRYASRINPEQRIAYIQGWVSDSVTQRNHYWRWVIALGKAAPT